MSTLAYLPAPLKGTAQIVCENVRAETARRGWSARELGRALGSTPSAMSPSSLSRRWRGAASWPLEELDDVAKVLNVAVEDLLRARRDSNPNLLIGSRNRSRP